MTSHSHAPVPGFVDSLSAAEQSLADERGVPKHLGNLRRKVQLDGYDKETGTVTMAVSSETPVDRWFGSEILSHEAGAIDTDRLKRGVALLFNHDYDQHLGRSQSFKLEDGVLRVTCDFATNALAQEKRADVASGHLVDVSIGYRVNQWDIVEKKDGSRTYTATDWELLEVSLVTVPADPTVGVGRSSDPPPNVRSFTREADDDTAAVDAEDDEEADTEDEDERSLDPSSAPGNTTSAAQRTAMPETQNPPAPAATDVVDVAAQRAQRETELRALHTQYGPQFNARSLQAAIDLNADPNQVRARIFDAIVTEAQRSEVPTIADAVFGAMSERELGEYSLSNAYRAAVNSAVPNSFTARGTEGGFEREVSDALRKEAEKRGLSGLGAGILLPSAASRVAQRLNQRALQSTGNAGVQTNFTTVEVDPIELLRPRAAVLALGARMMPGLQGNVQMPRQTGAATSSWVPETSAVTSSDPTLDSITLSPKPLMIANAYYRNLLAQSRLSVDSFLANDRLRVLALSIDTAVANGPGTGGIPLGLLNQTGLPAILSGTTRSSSGAVTAGAGGVPMTYVDFNNMEAAIAMANADIGTLGWLTTPRVRAAARSTPQIPGTASNFVWPNSQANAGTGVQPGPLGYNAICTTQSYLTGYTANSVNNLHAVIFGVWDQIIIGDWGLSEVIVDPYTAASSQQIKITENAFYDTNVRHIPAFCACLSALPS